MPSIINGAAARRSTDYRWILVKKDLIGPIPFGEEPPAPPMGVAA